MEKVSKGRAERAAKIEDLKGRFEKNQGGILTDYRGLNVTQITELRRKFRDQDVTYQVVKNTLTRLAVTGTSYEALGELLAGPTGIAFSETDAIAAARIATEFAKDHAAFEVKGGFMEGGVLSAAEVGELSKLGGRDQLLAQVLAVFNASSQRFLGVLSGTPRKFLGVLRARADQMEESA